MGEKAGQITVETARHVSKKTGCRSVVVKFSGVWASVVCLAGLEGKKQCACLYQRTFLPG